MKRLLISAILAIGLFGGSSCKKDWTCTCTHSTLNTTTNSAIDDQTWLNAKAQCQDMSVSSPLGTTSCSLDQ